MHVTCPSCKFGGIVRDDQIPPDGKEVYCPNCNIRFRIKKNPSFSAIAQQTRDRVATAQLEPYDSLPISCPVCGFKGKLRRSTVATGQPKTITCPSCKKPFTFTLPGADSAFENAAVSTGTSGQTPSSCPACASAVPHTLPICPSCGKILTGIKIHCPSCKSANVGINDETHGNGKSQWETVVFRPVSLEASKQANIRIPLSCRDCGKTWMIQPALIQTIEKPAGSRDR